MPITFPTADTGRQIKFPVRVASTANVTIQPGGTTLTIDGVALANNDRVLLKDQTTASQNGIYYVGGIGTSVTLNRSPDLSYVADFPALTEVPVALGTINGGTVWAMSSAAPATLGTSAIYFTRTYPSYEPATWRNPWLPATTAAQIVAATPLQENMSRLLIGSAAITPTTTVMTWAGGMVLPAGKTVSGVVLYAIAAGTLTARHVSLIRQSDRNILTVSSNSAASFVINSFNTQAFAPYTPPVDTPVWVGLGLVFSVAPTFGGTTGIAAANFGGGGAAILSGNGQAVTTTPPAAASTATAPTAGNAGVLWCGVY